MLKHLLTSVILIINFSVCLSQVPEDFPSIDKDDLPGAKFSSLRTFSGTSLFGYIDGGAELYLEYGFSMVSVTEIAFMDGKYKTEIYKMNGPEEAFGIFSVSKYRCQDMPSLSKFTCRTRYQLQICKGPFYISIINRTGTRTDSIALLMIGKIITDKIQEEEIDLAGYFDNIPLETLQTKCFLAKGRIGIVNGSPDLEDFFQGITGYTAVILKVHEKTLISVKFSSNESYQKFLELHNWEDDNLSTTGNIKKIADRDLLIELTR
jgi:hypothetical protein